MIIDPHTPARLDAAYGWPYGTVRAWLRSGVVPAGLAGDRLEHAALVAYLTRPALSADRLSSRAGAVRRDEITAAHAARVRDAIREVPCTTVAAPAASAASA